jgi:hypothetical protein
MGFNESGNEENSVPIAMVQDADEGGDNAAYEHV